MIGGREVDDVAIEVDPDHRAIVVGARPKANAEVTRGAGRNLPVRVQHLAVSRPLQRGKRKRTSGTMTIIGSGGGHPHPAPGPLPPRPIQTEVDVGVERQISTSDRSRCFVDVGDDMRGHQLDFLHRCD